MFGAIFHNFLFVAAILCVNSTPSIESSYKYQMIQGFQLQQNSFDGNSPASFTSTGLNESGSLGSTISQSLRKVQIGEVTMIVGGQNTSSAVCLTGGRVLNRFSVCQSSVQEVRPSTLGFIVFCGSGLIKLFNATCHLSSSFSLSPYSTLLTLAVLTSPNNVTFTAYIRRGKLVTYEFGRADLITLYTRSEIASTFGTCSVEWSPRTYNDTHFIFECPSSKRYLVNGFISNSKKEVLTGPLYVNTGEDEAVVITGDHSFTYYWKGFGSQCRINVPQSTSLLTEPTTIDFGKNNAQTIIVLFNSYNTFVYDTSRGCKDEYLRRLNVTYPCVTGKCDGYYIVEDGPYLVAVNNRSSKLTLDLFYFSNATAAPHTITNLQGLPDVLNVNKSQVPTSTQVISSTISSQMMTSTSTTIASSTSLLITTSSTTSTSTLLLPSSTNPLPSSALPPRAGTSPISLYVFLAIPAVIAIFLIIVIACCAIICCVVNRKRKSTTSHPICMGMIHSSSTSTTSSAEEPSGVLVMEETGLTAEPITASPSTNSLCDYKNPTTEESNPDPSSLVLTNQ